jgi:hypothetical protein
MKRYLTIRDYLAVIASALCICTGTQSVAFAAGSFASQNSMAASESFLPPLDAKIVEMMKTNLLGSVEAKIHFVEKWDITRVQKAQVLFAMLARAAEEDDQRKLAHAAVPYVASTNYALVRQHLFNPKLPRVVLSVFMTDTLKRDYRTKLPAILSLAQISGHPMQPEAQQLLRGYLGRDHGTDWAKWEETINLWLKNNLQ